MAKRKVVWTKEALENIYQIMDYYTNRNKSTLYSSRLYKEIQIKLKTLDFSVAYPKKTPISSMYYLTHNHIFVGFDIINNNIIVQLVIDDRRSSTLIERLLSDLR